MSRCNDLFYGYYLKSFLVSILVTTAIYEKYEGHVGIIDDMVGFMCKQSECAWRLESRHRRDAGVRINRLISIFRVWYKQKGCIIEQANASSRV